MYGVGGSIVQEIDIFKHRQVPDVLWVQIALTDRWGLSISRKYTIYTLSQCSILSEGLRKGISVLSGAARAPFEESVKGRWEGAIERQLG